MYSPLTGKLEIKKCFDAFQKAFSSGTVVRDVKPGGHKSSAYIVRWHQGLGIWSCFVDDWRRTPGKPDWSALFGIDQPSVGDTARIEFEVNYLQNDPTPYFDQNPRWVPAGRYMKDRNGSLFIGRTTYFNKGQGQQPDLLGNNPLWKNHLVDCDWGHKVEKVLFLGEVNDPKLPLRIAAAAKNLYNIKERPRFKPSEISPNV